MTSTSQTQRFPPVSAVYASLRCRCPRCGRGRLFRGYLQIAPACKRCGLDFGFADAGDGPAVFVILIAGFLVSGGALLMDIAYAPPYWLTALIWLPMAALVPLALLRPLKASLIVLQYKHKAAEGKLSTDAAP